MNEDLYEKPKVIAVGSAQTFWHTEVTKQTADENYKRIKTKQRLLHFIQTQDFSKLSVLDWKCHLRSANRLLYISDIIDLLRVSHYKLYFYLGARKREFSGFAQFSNIQKAITHIEVEMVASAQATDGSRKCGKNT